MTFFKIISQYFWAIAILVTYINTASLKRSSREHIQQNPERAKDYSKFMRWFSFWMNLPWFIMGIGCIIGRISVWHYFRPRDGNPFVLAWWILLFVLYILSFYWIFFRKGAEKLAEYRVFWYHSIGESDYISSPMKIKLVFLLMITGGLIAAVAMWTKDIPLPPFLLE